MQRAEIVEVPQRVEVIRYVPRIEVIERVREVSIGLLYSLSALFVQALSIKFWSALLFFAVSLSL